MTGTGQSTDECVRTGHHSSPTVITTGQTIISRMTVLFLMRRIIAGIHLTTEGFGVIR